MKMSIPSNLKSDPTRFLKETRLSNGRVEFERYIDEQLALETRTAIYGALAPNREIAAGRAQVWLEIQSLFQRP